jgi:hypothetical protein
MEAEKAREYLPLVEAMAQGKIIQHFIRSVVPPCPYPFGHWQDETEPSFADPAVLYRVKPEPTKRPMTREEVLGFLANTPGIVTRYEENEWHHPGVHRISESQLDRYWWARIDARGKIGFPHRFEITEEGGRIIIG